MDKLNYSHDVTTERGGYDTDSIITTVVTRLNLSYNTQTDEREPNIDRIISKNIFDIHHNLYSEVKEGLLYLRPMVARGVMSGDQDVLRRFDEILKKVTV
jgi:hypothetical protein